MTDTPKPTPSSSPLKPLLWVAIGIVGTVVVMYTFNGVPQDVKEAPEAKTPTEQVIKVAVETQAQKEQRLAEAQRQTDEALLQNGQWRDPATNLIWTRCSLGQTWNGSGCDGQAKELDWWDAHQAALNHSEGGHSDWRLPTQPELASLLAGTVQQGKAAYLLKYKTDGEERWNDLPAAEQRDEEQNYFYSGKQGFGSKYWNGDTDFNQYWSASVSSIPPKSDIITGFAWATNFYSGQGSYFGRANQYRVRLVRASQSLAGGNDVLLAFEQKAKNIYQDQAYLDRQKLLAQLESAQQKSCDHVYVGKEFQARGGGLGMVRFYVVVGVSAASQQVTIRSKLSDYRQEISCSDVPN